MFVIIYITDTLMFATNSVCAFLYVKRFGVIFIAAAMVLYRNAKNREGIQPVIIFLSGSIMISAILAGRFTTGYSYYTMIACIWLAYLFSREYSVEQFSYCFCRVMRIIAIVSLIGWLFASMITSVGAIPVITNTVGVKYKNLFLTVVPVLAHHAKRNMGPFWEPGAYQVYLNVALYFTLFIEKHKKKALDAVCSTNSKYLVWSRLSEHYWNPIGFGVVYNIFIYECNQKYLDFGREYPILLPYYYAKRIVTALCGVRKRKIKLNPYKNIDGDKERLKLIEKLDMI